jgi:hypothetical protein
MTTVNYLILSNSVVVTFDGKRYSITKDDYRYNGIIEAIKAGDFAKVKELADIVQTIRQAGFMIQGDSVILDGQPLEGVIAGRIVDFHAKGLPFEPLLKFARKLRLNPSYNSREQLFKFLEHNGHPITSEGNFIAYRGITEDFKDMHTKTWDNSIGSICEMNRQEVDDNPNNTCSKGLHVACYDYAKSFGQKLVEVEVNPIDVVCVPTDYNGTKMRVCKFKVVSLCEKVNDNSLVDSSYVTDTFNGLESLLDDYKISNCSGCESCDIDESESDEIEVDTDWQLVILGPSSMVAKAEYNKHAKLLDVMFKNGSMYRFKNVPGYIIDTWEESDSVGKFFNERIRSTYDMEHIA